MSDLALLMFVYYLAFHGRPGGLKFFSFFGGFKITETSQRVRVGRQTPCMGRANDVRTFYHENDEIFRIPDFSEVLAD